MTTLSPVLKTLKFSKEDTQNLVHTLKSYVNELKSYTINTETIGYNSLYTSLEDLKKKHSSLTKYVFEPAEALVSDQLASGILDIALNISESLDPLITKTSSSEVIVTASDVLKNLETAATLQYVGSIVEDTNSILAYMSESSSKVYANFLGMASYSTDLVSTSIQNAISALTTIIGWLEDYIAEEES